MSYTYNLGLAFEEVAERYGDNVALWFERDSLVLYRELNSKANQIARYLLGLGLGKGDVVCIFGWKTTETFAGMIACLKTGLPYVILDRKNPRSRNARIFQTCQPKNVLFQALLQRELEYSAENLKETHGVTGANPAYIMYTSGSTGQPKGAVMTHANLLNFIDWSITEYDIWAGDVLTNVNPLHFDNSVFDFYTALFSGASMVPISREVVTDPGQLVRVIDEAGCTIWFSVPSLLIYLDTMRVFGHGLNEIQSFIFGGEGYPKAKLKRLYDAYPKARLFNVYGPTECTCICSSHEIEQDEFEDLRGFPSLGRIADNFSYLILDEDGEMVEDGEPGELCLLGPQVGLGYYNDPERTAAAFEQNPFNEHHEERMYRTGDVVRHKGGKLYILGRRDQQIKHMGHRVELGEIETALCQLDYVSEAVALYGAVRGLDRIVAVVNVEEGAGVEIREDSREMLPEYMIPADFHLVSGGLPKNANGKVDRVRLKEAYL